MRHPQPRGTADTGGSDQGQRQQAVFPAPHGSCASAGWAASRRLEAASGRAAQGAGHIGGGQAHRPGGGGRSPCSASRGLVTQGAAFQAAAQRHAARGAPSSSPCPAARAGARPPRRATGRHRRPRPRFAAAGPTGACRQWSSSRTSLARASRSSGPGPSSGVAAMRSGAFAVVVVGQPTRCPAAVAWIAAAGCRWPGCAQCWSATSRVGRGQRRSPPQPSTR